MSASDNATAATGLLGTAQTPHGLSLSPCGKVLSDFSHCGPNSHYFYATDHFIDGYYEPNNDFAALEMPSAAEAAAPEDPLQAFHDGTSLLLLGLSHPSYVISRYDRVRFRRL